MNFQSNGKKIEEKPQIITANIYDDPQFALDLVAHVCTEKEDIEIDSYFDVYNQKIENLSKEVSDLDDKLMSDNCIVPLFDTLRNLKSDARDAVLNTFSSKLKIAVAGGYSAGKSSLLNALTEIGNKLPTDLEPVSMVNTQLNCKKRKSTDEKLVIRGINLADKYVKLDEEVLSCIQHSSKYSDSLASVLKSIILDIPSPEFLDGITFVDTPGYNNSPDKNNVSDSETARKGIESADCIIWCINIGRGTIPNSDYNLLATIAKEKPVYIFLTRFRDADNSSLNVLKEVYEKASNKLKKLLGVAGVSIQNSKIEYFYPYKSNFNAVSDIIKMFLQYAKTNVGDDYVKRLEYKFDEVIDYLEQRIVECENERMRLVNEKGEFQNICHQSKKDKKDIEKLIKAAKQETEKPVKYKKSNSINLQEIIGLLYRVIQQGNPRVQYLLDYICDKCSYNDLDKMVHKKSLFGSVKSVFDVPYDRSFLREYADKQSNPYVNDMLKSLCNLVDIRDKDFEEFKGKAWAFKGESARVQSTPDMSDEEESTTSDRRKTDIIIVELYKALSKTLALYDEKIKMRADSIAANDKEIDNIIAQNDTYTEIKRLLSNYKPQLSNALKNAYLNAKQKVEAHLQEQKSPKDKSTESSKSDIFTAIKKDDYKAFVKCFAGEGVDMQKERYNGYSPLTYAVSQGNNLMVKFFIEQHADLTSKDSNDCNAFETAVKFHYQDICEMLLEADDSLPPKCGDLKELYNQNSFKNFIEKFI